MILGFQSRFIESVCSQDGRNWKLLTPMVYKSKSGRIFIVPRGCSTDGPSIPSILFSLLPPTGDYYQSCILHDSGYQNTLLEWPSNTLLPDFKQPYAASKANLSKSECDSLLKEAMELSGVDEITANIIYQGVNLGGATAFKEDRS